MDAWFVIWMCRQTQSRKKGVVEDMLGLRLVSLPIENIATCPAS